MGTPTLRVGRLALTTLLALLLACGPGGTEDPVLEGVWRRTQVQDCDTLSQESLRLEPGGQAELQVADFLAQDCRSGSGHWSLEGDSLVLELAGLGEDWPLRTPGEWRGAALSLANPAGGPSWEFTKAASWSSCESYGFLEGPWTGQMTATIGDQSRAFNLDLRCQRGGCSLEVVGSSGIGMLNLIVMGAAPGHYHEDQASLAWIQEVAYPEYSFVTRTLDLWVREATRRRVVCDFTALLVHPQNAQETRVLSAGQIDLHRP